MKKFFEIKNLLRNYGVIKILTAGSGEIYRKIWLEFFKNSYSQNGEDIIVENLFKKNYEGKYLEIGAYHPTRLSNTYRFYKKGWRGVVVEPNPDVRKLFKKYRPEDKFIGEGISDKKQSLDYYQFLIPALNTFSKIEAEESIKNGHKLESILKIQTVKVESVVNDNIDFLSIDTEGFDEMILKNWPWRKCVPKIICVEGEVSNILNKIGYKITAKTKDNTIFVFEK